MALFPPFAWLASGIAGGAFLTNQFKDSSTFLKKVDMPKIESTPRYIPFISTQQNQDPILSEMKKIVIYGLLGSVSIYLISVYFKKNINKDLSFIENHHKIVYFTFTMIDIRPFEANSQNINQDLFQNILKEIHYRKNDLDEALLRGFL